MTKQKWGYLRETQEAADKAGIDPDTNLYRTGLEKYLEVIFPDVHDWIHDSPIGELNGVKRRIRPDYRSESLKLIIEFDGLQHYNDPTKIIKDKENTALYENGGYTVVRIPFFIQLTKDVVKTMFGRDVDELFDPTIQSMGIKGKNTPAFLCPLGIDRMAQEMLLYPSQMAVNLDFLKKQTEEKEGNDLLTGYTYLLQSIEKYK